MKNNGATNKYRATFFMLVNPSVCVPLSVRLLFGVYKARCVTQIPEQHSAIIFDGTDYSLCD